MQVQSPEAAEQAAAADDEISEPEEDSIAGQMAAMRGRPVKRVEEGEEDEYTTSDSEEEDSTESSSDSDSD